MKKQHSFLNFISLFITFVLITSKLTLGWASERNPIIKKSATDHCPSTLLRSSQQEKLHIRSQQAITASVLGQGVKDDSAGPVFIRFAKKSLGKDFEELIGVDWQGDIVKHTQHWKKQDAIDFLLFLINEIGIEATLNAIKNTSYLRWILYKPFRDKTNFLEESLGRDRYLSMLKKTPLKVFAPNNVKGIRGNVEKVERIIGKEQTIQLLENDFGAFTVINTEIDNIEQYLREDRNISTRVVHEMITKNIRAFMNARLHYIQARFSYLEGMSGISTEDANQMMVDKPLAFIESYFAYNRSPLHMSVYVGDIYLVSSLINHGIDVNTKDIEGWTPLHVESYTGDKNLASLLIENRADVNAVDKMGLTPLHVAVYRQNMDIASLLINAGASVNIPDKAGWTPLFLAIFKKDIDMVTLLLEADADINYRDPNTGWTALHLALYIEDIASASLLIERGANVNTADNEGFLPLHIAAYMGDVRLISLMIRYKAIHSSVFQTMRSPIKGSLFYWALYGSNPIEVASFLIEHRNKIIIDDEAELTEEERSAWALWVNWFVSGGYKVIITSRYNEEESREYQDRQNATIHTLDKKIDKAFFHEFINRILYQEHNRDEKIEELLTFLKILKDSNTDLISGSRTPVYWEIYSAAEEVISFLRDNYHPRSSTEASSTNTE